MSTIPRKGKAVDGVSVLPGRELVPFTDWIALEREFLANPSHTKVATWLRLAKGWPNKKIFNGNTLEHVAGWGKKRAKLQQEITQRSLEEVVAAERSLLPQLRLAKLRLLQEVIAGIGNYRNLEPAEQRTFYQIIKTELGEPVSIKVQGIISPRDPVEALLEEYGLMKDGVIIDDEFTDDGPAQPAGGGDSQEAPAADSSAHAEVSQG